LISFLAFSETSPLYEKLVLDEQCVDMLWASNADHVDPYLYTILTRVKDPGCLPRIEKEILATMEQYTSQLVDGAHLETVKSHLRYRFALSLDHTEAIASTLAHYVSLRRTPETINRLYELYAQITPVTLRETARRYFHPKLRTTVTLRPGGAA